MKVINTLTKGIMNKSTDKSLVPQDFHIDAENLRFGTTKNNDGIGKSIKGTLKVSDSTDDNSDYKCICATFNKKKDTILYFLATTDGMLSKIVEFNTNTNVTVNVTEDNRGVLKFDKNGYITGVNVIDDLLVFSEWGNNIRRINIERSKNYGLNGFEEEDITLIVKPPYTKPTLNLQTTTSDSQEENNIEEKFIVFSYRWRYLDGEYSALAPFTLPAFEPKKFEYDFSVQSNKSMVNKYNEVEIGFNTGGKNVTEIQLVFKESGDNEVFIINDFVKELMDDGAGWGDNETKTFNFSDFNSIRGLSKTELRKMFDNVPRTALAQTVIDGRLIFANYKENYNIVDSENNKINIDYELEIESTNNTVELTRNVYNEQNKIIGQETIDVPSLNPVRTCRSNRGLEVVVSYMDEYLRATTLLKSTKNTIHIPSSLSQSKNEINVILKNKPPNFAKYFRFFIKQNETHYDQIIPTLFYEDGIYVWVLIENSEIDKVKEGCFLIVKSDTKGIVNPTVKTKVLEVKRQDKDFLEIEGEEQKSGLYFKVKPNNYTLEFDDLELNEIQSPITRAGGNVEYDTIGTIENYISESHYYGDTLNDMESFSTIDYNGVYTESQPYGRSRYTIQIDGTSTPNTFKWTEDDLKGNTNTVEDVEIEANTWIDLSKGVKVRFSSETGHSLNDVWNINARSVWNHLRKSRSYNNFKVSVLKDSEAIYAGARIKLKYSEFGRGSENFEIENTASQKYDNIQEWFYKENIIDLITNNSNVVMDSIHFIRNYWHNQDNEQSMTMAIRSIAHGTWLEKSKSKGITEILNNNDSNLILFETEPKETPSDIFYEIGKTYKIENGFHLGDGVDDVNQTISTDLKVKLDWFNAFSYGNGVESYKIKDEFNSRGIDVGTRVSSTSKQEYKETIRTEDVTWSDVYNADASFNGLNSFNLSLINFLPLDRENGSIQKIYNKNSNLIILQEDGIGRIPYNKNIIYDTQGGKVVGISTNILNKESYFSYGAGKHGISKNPEGFVSDGFRDYFPDKQRGAWLRLSNDGITPISQNFYDHEFSDLMIANKYNNLIAGFDPKHKEILLYTPNENKCLTFKEKSKGLPNKFTFEPDFMIHANNELYSWKNGIMYKHNQTELANDFYGIRYDSKLKLIVNHQFGYEKIFKALGLYSTHAWLVNLKTRLSSRQIPKDSFRKINDHFYSEIMGDTSDNIENNSIFGIGSYPIVDGKITVLDTPTSLSIGDKISSKTLLFTPSTVLQISNNVIIINNPITTVSSFLMYHKNQNVDGGQIKGDFMEVELISDETEQVEIRAVKTEVEIINKN